MSVGRVFGLGACSASRRPARIDPPAAPGDAQLTVRKGLVLIIAPSPSMHHLIRWGAASRFFNGEINQAGVPATRQAFAARSRLEKDTGSSRRFAAT